MDIFFKPACKLKKGHNLWLNLPEDAIYYFAITKKSYIKLHLNSISIIIMTLINTNIAVFSQIIHMQKLVKIIDDL